jgi:hypothetical protein
MPKDAMAEGMRDEGKTDAEHETCIDVQLLYITVIYALMHIHIIQIMVD